MTRLIALGGLAIAVAAFVGAAPAHATTATTYGRLDSVTSPPRSVQVSGWAFQAGNPNPITVAVTIGGVVSATALANRYRPDVARIMHTGSYHG